MDEQDNLLARQQIISTILLTADHAGAVVEVLSQTLGDDAALVDALVSRFGVTAFQAGVIVDMQMRRFSPRSLAQARSEVADIERRLRALDVIPGELASTGGELPDPRPPMYRESSNHQPGQPLRSWLDDTPVVKVDALASIQLSGAGSALSNLLENSALEDAEVIALGRLNSFCVERWYEPMVTLLDRPFIDPATATFVRPLAQKLDTSIAGVTWSRQPTS